VVYWPGQSTPTLGGPNHRAESERFSRAFPDNVVKHPYDILFGEDDYTCFVTRFTGTFIGPLTQYDGTVVQPTGKSFDVLYSTTARWRNGKIIEEYLFYDSATFIRQIGLA
jgi:hypothetical protein